MRLFDRVGRSLAGSASLNRPRVSWTTQSLLKLACVPKCKTKGGQVSFTEQLGCKFPTRETQSCVTPEMLLGCSFSYLPVLAGMFRSVKKLSYIRV